MKILYDYQAFELQRYGGVSNCFTQLIKNMPSDVDIEIGIRETNNIHLLASGIIDIIPPKNSICQFIKNQSFRGKMRLYKEFSNLFPHLTSRGRNILYSIEKIKGGDYDVFHPTFFDTYFLPYLKDKPFVLTVHDMIPELLFPPNDKQAVEKAELVKRASYIVAVSENTKNDLVNILNVPESKISVIYHGAPETKCVYQKPIVDSPYLLYVGSREGYKYFMPMLKCLLPFLANHLDINIVCTGPCFTYKELCFFKENGISSRMIHVNGDDEMMMNLYSHALCFIFPSIQEGFGMPILEAYKANCPVLLNNKSCFPEIAQDAALYFDLTENWSNLLQVIESFLTMSDSSKANLLRKQRERLEFFSWKKSSEQLYEVYKSLCYEN